MNKKFLKKFFPAIWLAGWILVFLTTACYQNLPWWDWLIVLVSAITFLLFVVMPTWRRYI